MTIFETLFGGRGEQRSLEAGPLTWAGLADFIGMGDVLSAGMPVTERSALRMSAVYRCVNVISSVSAALPLPAYARGTKRRVASALLDDPNGEMTPYEVWRLSYVHRTLWGNSYAQKLPHRIRAQGIRELNPLMPDRMRVYRYPPQDGIPGDKLFDYTDDWGTQWALSSKEVLHIPGLGYDGTTGCSPIRLASQGIGLALAAEKSGAKFFANGAMLSGVLQVEQRLSDDAAAALKARWKARVQGSDNAYDIAVLDSNAKFQPITMPLRDAQFLESRRFQTVEIARMFGVPLFLLMETEKSTSWGTGLEQQAQGFVVFDLHPTWLAPTEQRVTKELLPSGQYAKYTVQGLLRGDSQARAEFYRAMREIGAFSANDIRDLEDREPVEGGDVYLQPLNMAPLGAPVKAPAQGKRDRRLWTPPDDDLDELDDEAEDGDDD